MASIYEDECMSNSAKQITPMKAVSLLVHWVYIQYMIRIDSLSLKATQEFIIITQISIFSYGGGPKIS